MVVIKWFPGHMKKTLTDIKMNIKFVDFILIVLDARIPVSSMNFDLLKALNNKPVLILFNKTSLADFDKNHLFVDFFKQKKLFTLNIDAKTNLNINKIYPLMQSILKIKKFPVHKKILKLMIVGVPNVGKSTLINALSQRKAVKTANTPGVTKRLQWITLNNNMKLLDTPGVLYHNFTDPQIGYSLAISGCIKPTLLPKEVLVEYLLTYLKKHYKNRLKRMFKLDDKDLEEENLLPLIAQKANFLLKNNVLDENKLLEMIVHKIGNNKKEKFNFDLDLISTLKF